MRVLSKKKDEIQILFKASENLTVGSILKVGEIISQVIDIEYTTPIDFSSNSKVTPFLRTARCKIRGKVEGKRFNRSVTELVIEDPNTPIETLSGKEIMRILDFKSEFKPILGETKFSEPNPFPILLDRLGINLITGMKGSGKSYAAKKILLRLVDEGKTVIIFDLNGEYVNLGRDTQGNFGKYGQKITVLDPTALTPHENILPLQIPVNEMSYHDFAGIVGIEPKSDLYNQLILFWTRSVGDFDLDDFESWVNTNVGNFPLKFALKERIGVAKSLGLFGRVNFERIISRYEEAGGGIVVNFKFSSKRERMVIIEFIIKVITKLRKQKKINPIAIFAEEAQLYVSQNLWDDLLTRMRHYGIFPTFITNDPRTLPDEVFSLCDNLIAFRFHNTDDLEQLSKAKVIDRETLDVLKFLENKNCIFVGDCTDNFPIVVEIAPEKEVMMGGETQTMF